MRCWGDLVRECESSSWQNLHFIDGQICAWARSWHKTYHWSLQFLFYISAANMICWLPYLKLCRNCQFFVFVFEVKMFHSIGSKRYWEPLCNRGLGLKTETTFWVIIPVILFLSNNRNTSVRWPLTPPHCCRLCLSGCLPDGSSDCTAKQSSVVGSGGGVRMLVAVY